MLLSIGRQRFAALFSLAYVDIGHFLKILDLNDDLRSDVTLLKETSPWWLELNMSVIGVCPS
jgi:hypothetical protein